jgi:hypothetical protein
VKRVAAKIGHDGSKGTGIIIGRYTYACYEVLLVVCADSDSCQGVTEPYPSC